MQIPPDSLYFVLAYAWDLLDPAEFVDLSAVPCDAPLDLLASVLVQGVRRLQRRGLDRGYVQQDEDGAAFRGKLDVAATLSRCLHRQARVAYQTDELTHDVSHNQVLKATLFHLERVQKLHPLVRREVDSVLRSLPPIRDVVEPLRLIPRVQLHRNNSCYALLLATCELILQNLVPVPRGDAEPDGPRFQFRDFTGDDRTMGHLFQNFVRNFLAREQSTFKVRREERISWDLDDAEELPAAPLPRMQADATLTGADRKILIETKCATQIWQVNFGTCSVRSEHLYQLFAYLQNNERRSELDRTACGLLLYAADREAIDVRTKLRGHCVHVRSLRLSQPWAEVARDLLALIRDAAHACEVPSTVASEFPALKRSGSAR